MAGRAISALYALESVVAGRFRASVWLISPTVKQPVLLILSRLRLGSPGGRNGCAAGVSGLGGELP